MYKVFTRWFRQRPFLTTGLFCGVVLGSFAAVVLFRASRAASESARDFRTDSEIRFTSTTIDRSRRAPFEAFQSAAVFAAAVVLNDRLYIGGPSGLFEYDNNGVLQRTLHPGLELPPAPIRSMAVGTSGGRQEILLATDGEGLVAVAEDAVRQIRPVEARLRKLTCVLPLSTGQILVGTASDGVLAYDGKRIRPFHPSLTKLRVTALAGDSADLWVGTIDKGVMHWHAGQLEAFGVGQGLPDQQVLSLAVDSARAFVGTPDGVAEFQNGRFTRALAEGVFANALLALGSRLLVGTLEEGVIPVELQTSVPRPVPSPRGMVPARIEQIFQTESGVMAVARDRVYSLGASGDSWRPVLQPESAMLVDSHISALAADSAGRLWIGYFDRGLDVLDSARSHSTHIENDAVYCVNRIAVEPGGARVAVATANGLVMFDAAGRERQTLTQRDGLIASHVTDVQLEEDGRMLLATPAGLTIVDAGGIRSINVLHGLVNNHVYAVAASGSTVLAGTLGGLSLLQDGVVKASYTTSNSRLKHHWITALARMGDLWFVGTYGAGVLRLDANGQWSSFPDETDAVVNPNALLASGSRIYAGTLDHGLYIYDRGAGRWTSITAGLPSRNVTALAARDGYLYVGTDNGLVRIPEQRLEN
jgi:ligand-binding sensor domain-containing protein